MMVRPESSTALVFWNGKRFEVEHIAPHSLPGVFDAQKLGTVPVSKLERFLTRLPGDKVAVVETAVQRWLGFIGNGEDKR